MVKSKSAYSTPTKTGKIDVTKYLQRCDCGKKIKTNQRGSTPKLTQ